MTETPRIPHPDARHDQPRRSSGTGRASDIEPWALLLCAAERWATFSTPSTIARHFGACGRIGVVGLGTGTIAAYPRKGQSLTYYEIDAAVKRIAEDPQYFTYLTNCRNVHEVDYKIKMGDARLTLAGEPDNAFDLLVIDAFSSDSIPIHLITREAMELYLTKLAPGGFLVVHVSNRHLDLPPVVAAAAQQLRLVARLCDDEDESEVGKSASTWAVLVQNKGDLRPAADLRRLETDDSSARSADLDRRLLEHRQRHELELAARMAAHMAAAGA